MAALNILNDEQELAEAAAERITTLIEQAIAERGRALIALAGGKTPERLYRFLADPARPWRSRIDWARMHLFWSDERHVPPDHPDSNYGMAARALIDYVPVPAHQVHRMRGELPDAAEAARLYDAELPAHFDVMLLGLGEDAHIASIFPGSPLLSSGNRMAKAAAVLAPQPRTWRITLTPDVILAARAIVMLVAGARKADAVRAALELPDNVQRYPAQLLRAAAGRVEWFIERRAAPPSLSSPRE